MVAVTAVVLRVVEWVVAAPAVLQATATVVVAMGAVVS